MFQEWFKDYEKLKEENNMSEKEIIEYFKEVISWHRKNTPDRVYALNNKDIEMIQSLLDLYNKEKEKNKLLIEGKFREVADKNSYIKDNYISKDKIKEIYEDAISANYDIQEIAEELEKLLED